MMLVQQACMQAAPLVTVMVASADKVLATKSKFCAVPLLPFDSMLTAPSETLGGVGTDMNICVPP